MEWTAEIPTKPGHYWLYSDITKITQMVQFREITRYGQTHLMWLGIGWGRNESWAVCHPQEDRLFYGPIPVAPAPGEEGEDPLSEAQRGWSRAFELAQRTQKEYEFQLNRAAENSELAEKLRSVLKKRIGLPIVSVTKEGTTLEWNTPTLYLEIGPAQCQWFFRNTPGNVTKEGSTLSTDLLEVFEELEASQHEE